MGHYRRMLNPLRRGRDQSHVSPRRKALTWTSNHEEVKLVELCFIWKLHVPDMKALDNYLRVAIGGHCTFQIVAINIIIISMSLGNGSLEKATNQESDSDGTTWSHGTVSKWKSCLSPQREEEMEDIDVEFTWTVSFAMVIWICVQCGAAPFCSCSGGRIWGQSQRALILMNLIRWFISFTCISQEHRCLSQGLWLAKLCTGRKLWKAQNSNRVYFVGFLPFCSHRHTDRDWNTSSCQSNFKSIDVQWIDWGSAAR